jgi:hypothetical protein
VPQPQKIPSVVQKRWSEVANGSVMSARLGDMNESPSKAPAWTTIAAIVAIASASWVARRSGPRRRTRRPLMRRPTVTDVVARSKARMPAARLVIQNR